jgi:hypothetical protein
VIEILLSWIVRVLFVIFVIRLAMRAFGGVRRTSGRWSPPGAGSAPRERVGGNLVRDPQCGTYVPISRAVRLGTGEHAQYFCSASCRDLYAAGQSSVAS